jgi:hypothetical protein
VSSKNKFSNVPFPSISWNGLKSIGVSSPLKVW